MPPFFAKRTTVPTSHHFSIQSLFVVMVMVAVPLACFRQYFNIVSNTVDESILPLREAPPVAILFFALGLLFVFALSIRLFVKKRYYLFTGLMVTLAVILAVGFLGLKAGMMETRGRPEIAQLHSDAAALVGDAVTRFYQRTASWPKSWMELAADVEAAKAADKRLPTAQQPNTSAPQALDLARDKSLQELSSLVDIDFNARLNTIRTEAWYEFSGIRPHKPAYNFYRVQFEQLIQALAARPSDQ